MSAKSIVYQKLKNTTAVTDLVPIITQKWYDKDLPRPQLTITRVGGERAEISGDNDASVKGSIIQVDIWTDQSPTPIENAVINALSTIPEYQRSRPRPTDDTYDTDEKLNRVTIEVIIYL